MKEEQNIEKIINKFLDFLTTIVEEQEDLKINMSEDLETYYYVTNDLLEILNKDKLFFIDELEKDHNKEEIFVSYIKKVLPDDYNLFLYSLKNLYYLKNSNLSSEIIAPQIKTSEKEVNNFINKLNRYVCEINSDLYEDSIKKITTYIENIMDLANEIQFREVITNIDLLEKILEKSFLSDAEEEILIEYLIKNNIIKYYNIEDNKNNYEEISIYDEKEEELEDLLEENNNLKKLISLIEEIPVNKVNLNNYKENNNYTEDIKAYLEYARNIIEEYLKDNSNLSINDAVNKFFNDKKEKIIIENIYYIYDNNKSFIEEDIDLLDKKDRKEVKDTLNKLKEKKLKFRKENFNFSTLTLYDAHTIKDSGLTITYIPINDKNIILLGITNKKLLEHYNIMEKRAKENEDQIISIMKKIIQNKDIKAEKLKTDKSTERIIKKLENKEETEVLEEFKFV